MKKLFLSCLIVTGLCFGFLVPKAYHLVRDVDALIDRAQVAADRDDMVEYLTALKANLEKNDMTTGHFALILTTPANDLALNYRAVNRILERLESIKGIAMNETAYQVALDDIRGTIRELPNPSLGYMWAHFWFLYLIPILLWACMAGWVIIWMLDDMSGGSSSLR